MVIAFDKITSRNERQEFTHITLVNKDWVVGVLNENIKHKRQNIEWMKRVAGIVRGGKFDAAAIPRLPGTEVKDESGEGTKLLRFLDSEYERQKATAKNPDEMPTQCAGIEFGPDPLTGRRAAIVHFKFDHYSPNATPKIYEQPEMGTGVLNEVGNNALDLVYGLLVPEANSALLQQYFPPKTGTIKFVRPGNSSSWPYYEWETEDGWKVTCDFNDMVVIETVPIKRL